MQEQINDIRTSQQEQGLMISKMHDAIIGDKFRDGIISEVKKNSNHRKQSLKVNGFIAGISIIIGSFLSKFWGNLF